LHLGPALTLRRDVRTVRPRGIGVRRRRRGPEGLRAAGGARRTTFSIGGQGDGRVLRRPGVSASVRRAPKIGDHAGSGALPRALETVEKVLTGEAEAAEAEAGQVARRLRKVW
jgi:hypothetical protein